MNIRKPSVLYIIIIIAVLTAMATSLMIGCAAQAPAPAPKVVTAKIGFCAPLTGPVSPWGLPGLWGIEVIVDEVNANGGIELADGTRVMLEIVSYDDENIPDKALAGVRKLVLEDKVNVVMTLGGAVGPVIVPWLTEQKMISLSLTGTDLNPGALYHMVPFECTPLESVTQFNTAVKFNPGVKTVALAVQDDDFGRFLMGACCASAESAGLEIVYNELYDASTTDFAPVVSAMLATNPDIFATVGSYVDFTTLLFEQAYLQGFKGLKQQGALDNLEAIIDRTSVEFMEGTISHYPLMDDPKLSPEHNAFYQEYERRHPGQTYVVVAEYAWSLKLWIAGVEAAGSIEPMKVFEALMSLPNPPHCFGEGVWWGKPLWGNDNLVIPNWPVCTVQDGKIRILEFTSLIDWWKQNKELLIKWEEEYDQMWYQRLNIPRQVAIDEYGLLD